MIYIFYTINQKRERSMARGDTAASKAKPVKTGVTTKSPAVKAAAKKSDVAVAKKPMEMQAKPAVRVKPAAEAKPAAEVKEKPKKVKLVRDSFTMPETEYAVLGEVKKACLNAGIEVKKSELLRIGVALIRTLDVAKLKESLDALPALKAGRPKKTK
jgi:hypothetical protein